MAQMTFSVKMKCLTAERESHPNLGKVPDSRIVWTSKEERGNEPVFPNRGELGPKTFSVNESYFN